MAQHDGTIDDQTGITFLPDLNAAIAALMTNNSGASAPLVTFANQWWADTANTLLKRRNAANSAWITVCGLGDATLALLYGGTGASTAAGARTNLGLALGADLPELLKANRNYYVRTDGNDSNTGLANTAGGAFLTIQKAIDVVCGTLDLGIYNATINVADGTYTGGVVLKPYRSAGGAAAIVGNTTTPANCIISPSGAHAVYALPLAGYWWVQGFKLSSGGGACLVAESGVVLDGLDLNFGAAASYHVNVTAGGTVRLLSNYTISGNALVHWYAIGGGATIQCQGRTITLSGTPAFTYSFAIASLTANQLVNGNTFSGSATGQRYSVDTNGVLYTLGGATYLPGNSAGAAGTGGQYV